MTGFCSRAAPISSTISRPSSCVYREGNRTTFGTNITESIGQKMVAYVEWAGGRRVEPDR